MTTLSMLDVALAHAAAGRRVFPADPATKRPMITGWPDLATTDAETIRAWWSEVPGAMPGWALPTDIGCVDCDPRNGAEITKPPGELPDTRAARTAGGGFHLFYRVPADRPIKNGKIADGWDCKTSGGYVVLDGAERADGKRYELAYDLPIADAPEWLLVAKARGKAAAAPVDPPVIWAAPEGIAEAMTPGLVALLAPRLAAKGHRHDIARAVGGALAHAGWTDDGIADLVRGLPSDAPADRARDAVAAAQRARQGLETPQWGALGRAGYAPGIVAAARTMATGGKYDALEADAAATWAERASAPPPEASAWIEMSVNEICAPLGPVDYVVQALDMAPGAPIMFGGYGFSGKTLSAQSLQLSIASGRKVWGAYAVRTGGGRALHGDWEQGKRVTNDRYQRLMRGLAIEREEIEGRLVVVPLPRVYFDATNIQATEDFLERKIDGFTSFLVDSFLAATPGLEENDSRVRHLLDMLTRISERTGCTCTVIHHARKTATGQGSDPRQALRGSSAIFDACGSVLLFEGEEPREPKLVTHTKARISGRPLDPFALTFTDGFVGDDRSVVVTASGAQEVKQAAAHAALEADCQAVLAFVRSQPGAQLAGGYRYYGAKLPGISEARIQRALEVLESERRLVQTADSTRAKPRRFIPGGAT